MKPKRLCGVLAACALACVFLAGCEKKPEVANEKLISLHYRGTLSDGSEFDSSEDGQPLEFIYGAGMMIPGFEKGIEGMREGEEKTIHVKAEDAYGAYDESRVVPVSKDSLPPDINPEIGMRLIARTKDGLMPVVIKDITATEIILDYNAPLAGQDLTFEIKIIAIRDPTEEELLPLKALGEGLPPDAPLPKE
ncbi:MAG: peptidylprolyl isomerase [Spirochaetia bacterium]|nr:peptidylprolyl isomerase [Spirochaetia bacterium]